MLESDFEHEFLLSIEIINEILERIDLNIGTANNGQLLVHKNEFRTNAELFAFRINWPNFPGLQNLLMKGCTCPSATTVETTQRLLVQLIPHCAKLNFVDPSSSDSNNFKGVAMNLISLLPTLIFNYERPNDLCISAAQAYYKVLNEQIQFLEQQRFTKSIPEKSEQVPAANAVKIQKTTKIEQLKNLAHVMNLYSTSNFGKDCVQWTKCVITYLSEYFEQCQIEAGNLTTASTSYYYKWIVFLTELLDKSKKI